MHRRRPDRVPAIPVHDRRTFLFGAGAILLAACSSSDGEAENGEPDGPESGEAGDSTTRTSIGETTDDVSADGDGASGDDADSAAESAGLDPLTPARFTALPICALAPSTTAGPFPTIDQLDRRDVTEGYPGHPLRLGIRVVNQTCEPVPGAQVEIWHTDATGDYSSYEDNGSGKDEGEGSTFLRGFQTADNDGILEFQTIYPGWYEGRAVHIHVRARVDGDEVLTSQLYFDEAYTETVMANGAYAEFGPPDTPWADDPIVGDPTTDGSGITLSAAATDLGAGTLGLINLAVSR